MNVSNLRNLHDTPTVHCHGRRWINWHQQQVIAYLKEENRVLKSKLPGGRLRLNDTERRRLAKLARPFDGLLLDKRYLIHDHDSPCTDAFDQYLRDNGVEPVVLPPRSPNVNAHGESCVRSIKEEALNRMIFIGEASLRYAIRTYLSHYHGERNHQGLDNQRIAPESAEDQVSVPVMRRERLGGILSYSYREAA